MAVPRRATAVHARALALVSGCPSSRNYYTGLTMQDWGFLIRLVFFGENQDHRLYLTCISISPRVCFERLLVPLPLDADQLSI